MDMEIVKNFDDGKIVIEKNGKEVECDVVFTFDCEDNGKSYIGYTDNEVVDGKKNIYVVSFDPIFGIDYEEVQTQEEWDMINEVIENI